MNEVEEMPVETALDLLYVYSNGAPVPVDVFTWVGGLTKFEGTPYASALRCVLQNMKWRRAFGSYNEVPEKYSVGKWTVTVVYNDTQQEPLDVLSIQLYPPKDANE